jgi:hypothetical protein
MDVLEDTILEKWREAAKSLISSWSAGARHLDHRFWRMGMTSAPCPFLANG